MALFKHKENIPELPVALSLPSINKNITSRDINELPTFPRSTNSQNDNFNQDLVKSAVTDTSENSYENEDETQSTKIPTMPLFDENRGKIMDADQQMSSMIPQKQTIYIKVEKFNALQEALSEIQEQIKSLTKQVELLKDVKIKQVQEINEWDNEMKKINQRLSRIDSDIFGEV